MQAALNAAILSNVTVRIWAVEKNFNAVVTLRNRFRQQAVRRDIMTENESTARRNTVTVLCCDMRQLRSVNKELCADIIVSELLGSWGDNEASPECLHSLEKDGFLKEGGVMIPQSYQSYLAPLSSSGLWMQARDMYLFTPTANKSGLDSPYVVNMHGYHLLADAKPVFQATQIFIILLHSFIMIFILL